MDEEALLERRFVPMATIVPPPKAGEDVCRRCNSSKGVLISPCSNCTEFRYIHRECLNEERANVDKPQNLYSCAYCDTEFKLVVVQDPSRIQRYKFHAYVFRDFFAIFCILQFAIMIFGVIVKEIDTAAAFCVPNCQLNVTILDQCENCPPIKAIIFNQGLSDEYDRSIYYTCGIVLLLASLGFFGLLNKCCKCVKASELPPLVITRPSNDTCCDDCCDCCCSPVYSYNSRTNTCNCEPMWWYCCKPRHHHHHHHNNGDGDCCRQNDSNCCESKNKSNSNASVILVIILVFIICAFAIVGIFYGLVLTFALFQRIVQRHMHLRELQYIATEYPVANLCEPLDSNVPYASIVSQVRGTVL
jgi:hypothetical protein